MDLGINNDGIRYEVALEILGQMRQPLMTCISENEAQAHPSEALLAYCRARLDALSEIQDSLRPDDDIAITRILDKNDPIFAPR